MDIYAPRVIKDNYKRSLSFMVSNLWNNLQTDVKEAVNFASLKQSNKYLKVG